MTTKITHKLLALAIAANAFMGFTNVKAPAPASVPLVTIVKT
jgi:hypothetical protein